MKKVFLLLTILISSTIVACPGVGNWNPRNQMGPGNMGNMMNQSIPSGQNWMGCQMSVIRHHYYMQNGLPAEYSALSNPLKVDDKALQAGKKVYEKNCMSCHGESGMGDGGAGRQLDPNPANLAAFAKMPMASDAYLFWTISDGGQKLNTAMPAFKGPLTKDEIWSLIAYIRKF